MKANPHILHLLLNETDWQEMDIYNARIENSLPKKLSGIKVDAMIKFEEHVDTVQKSQSESECSPSNIILYDIPTLKTHTWFCYNLFLILLPYCLKPTNNSQQIWNVNIKL